MIIFPAIDLKNGQCVRLFKGDMDMVTVFNHEPAVQVLEFQNQGFKYLHLVDLDGAVAGVSANIEAIKSIIAMIKIPLQLGGGIRSIADIEKHLDRRALKVRRRPGDSKSYRIEAAKAFEEGLKKGENVSGASAI